MAVTTIAYKDGNNVSKTGNAGSDGTNTTTGVTLFDSSGAYISTLPVSQAGGTVVIVTAAITRPANTTAYTIGDVVNDNSTPHSPSPTLSAPPAVPGRSSAPV
jgi:hypothetical protein